jgi:hypothetical protein
VDFVVGGGSATTFGQTAAYRAIMSGQTSSINNVNGYLQWATLDYSSNSMYSDNDGMLTGSTGGISIHRIRLMDDDILGNLNTINDRIGDFATFLEKNTRNQGGSIAFWTTPARSRSFNGINLRYYRNNWRGNGYTGATRSVAKYLSKGALVAQIALGTVEVGNGVADDYNDYQTKGVTNGRNTVVTAAKVTSSIIAGMYAGAVIGTAIPIPIVGTAVGAVGGAVVGYLIGEVVGRDVGVMYDNFEK